MSKDNYEAAFKGDRKAAEDAAMDIQKRMNAFTKGDGPYKLQFSCFVLKRICQAIVGSGDNYLIYCDIFETILAPNIEPNCNGSYWSNYLDFVRYYHSLLCTKKRYVEMHRVHNCIAKISNKLHTDKDYEYILQMFLRHLISLTGLTENETLKSDKVIGETANDITLLFKEMLQLNYDQNYVYKDLMPNIVPFLSLQQMRLLYTKFPIEMDAMFDAMIMLLTTQRMPNIAYEDSEALLVEYMEAAMAFLRIDITLQATSHALVLKFFKGCCRFKPFESNEVMAYVLQLLYFFAKFIFAQIESPYFTENYLKLCEKLQSFFNKSSETVKRTEWFINVLVTMSCLLFRVDDDNLLIFKVFRKQMRNCSAQVSAAHIELIYSLIKLAPSISQTKLSNWDCCGSHRKHITLRLVQCALKFYAVHMIDVSKKKTTDAGNESEITLTSIIHQGIEVINSMACIVSTSNEMNCFYHRLSSLLSKVTTDSLAKMCISLAQNLLKIKSKFSSQMWINIVRHLRALADVTEDSKLIAEFYAIYIGYLIKDHHTDEATLQNQIIAFYTTKNLGWDRYLLQILKMSKNSLKPILDNEYERALKTIELKIILKYQSKNMALMSSLLKDSESNSLEYVLIARQSKHEEAIKKLHLNYMKLKRKKNENAGLNCIDHLILAHTVVVFVTENVENLKKAFVLSAKEFTENDLDEILLKEEIINIDISAETQLINTILEAVQSFKAFFKEDLRLKLTPLEEKQIDWIAVLDDVSFLARILQSRGYLHYACEVWLLLYTIANTIDDRHNALRAFAFLCEHAAFFEQKKEINLHCEVNKMELIIFDSITDIKALVPRRQNYLLLSLCQLAFYYARIGNNAYAFMLLMFAKVKHDEIPCRQGKFDIVLATIEAVKFRIFWIDKKGAVRLNFRCIMRDIDVYLDHYRNIAYISSEDSWNYLNLMYDVIQEIAECTINRLCDNSLSNWLILILKTALETGSALRVIQILTIWAYLNLQMEYVDKAQIKLIVAKCFLKTENVLELKQKKILSESFVQKNAVSSDLLTLQMDSEMEAMRKMAQVNLSPIKKNTLADVGFDLNTDINRFCTYKNTKFECIDFGWTYVLSECINLRLCFLTGKQECLEQFYDYILDWYINQPHPYMTQTSQKNKLTIFHHYANFLRAHQKYDKALKTIVAALNLYNEFEMNVDTVYKINFELQKQATKYEMSVYTPKEKVSSVKLRRALEFKLSPENIKDQDRQEESVQMIKENTLDTAFIDLCSEEESLDSLDLSDKKSKSQKVNKSTEKINERGKTFLVYSNQIHKMSSSTRKETSCPKSEEQDINSGKVKFFSNTSSLGNCTSNLNKVNNEKEISIVANLEKIGDDIENVPLNIIANVKTRKNQANRDKNRKRGKKNPTTSNELTTKVEVLHINGNKNAKKEVVKQTCEPAPIVTAEKSRGRPKNITAEKTNNLIQVQEVRPKRNTRQKTKMLN